MKDPSGVTIPAAVGATFNNTQISQLPINGRNWGGLLTLTPGAIDTGAGNGASVLFFAQGGDDVNYRRLGPMTSTAAPMKLAQQCSRRAQPPALARAADSGVPPKRD